MGDILMIFSIKKYALAFSIMACFSSLSFANSEIKMNPEHRKALLYGVTQNVTREWLENDPVGAGCWDAAKSGDDVSLFAVYIIAKSTPIIIGYREAMANAAKSEGDNYDRYEMLKNAYNKIKVKEAGWYLQRTPAAVMHCMEISGGLDLSEEKEILSNEVRKRLDF